MSTVRLQPLEAGMVLDVELAYYEPGFGGVHVEDTLVVTEDGHRKADADVARPGPPGLSIRVSGGAPDDPLNAFCRENHIALAGAPSGPLAGVTFAAKDVFDVAGSVTGAGQPDWLRTHEPADATAPVVQALLDAGARLAGKTQCDELVYSLNGENLHYGTPVNPRAP